MGQMYIAEAFQKLRLLEDDFSFSEDDQLAALDKFIADDIEAVPEEPVYDLNADNESELQANYTGKVIIECDCCHSRFYKDAEEIIADPESDLVNVADKCPVCETESGYKVIGKIEAFDAKATIESEPEEEVEEDDDLEISDDEIEEALKEALNESVEEDKMSHDEAVKYWEENHFDDPVLADYDSMEDWLKDSKENGYITESCEEDGCEDESEDDIDESCKVNEGSVVDRLRRALDKMDESCEDDLDEDLSDEEIDALIKDEVEAIDGYSEAEEHTEEGSKEEATLDHIKGEEEEHIDELSELREGLTEAVTVDVNNGTVTSDSNEAEVDLNNGTVILDGDHLEEAPVDHEEEMIAPLSDEEIMDIEGEAEENEAELEGEENIDELDIPEEDLVGGDEDEIEDISDEEEEIEETPTEEDEEEELVAEESLELKEAPVINESIDTLENFDETSFNSICETYLKRVYENTKSFECSSVEVSDGKLVVEGLINFESGASRNTTFEFNNSLVSKRGKLVLEGINKTFSNNAKSFVVKGNVVDHNFISESMIYNYATKTLNEANESEPMRVYGRVIYRG